MSAGLMKLHAQIEIDVPDEVGQAILDRQVRDYEQQMVPTVYMNVPLPTGYSYTINAPLRWET